MTQVEVANPFWLRVILYLAVCAFALLAVYFAWLAVLVFFKTGLIATAIILPLALAMAHISHVGFRFFPFIAARLNFSDTGFVIENRGKTKMFQWCQVGSIEKQDYSELLVIRGRQDETVYIVDYRTPGFRPFLKVLEDNGRHDQTAA